MEDKGAISLLKNCCGDSPTEEKNNTDQQTLIANSKVTADEDNDAFASTHGDGHNMSVEHSIKSLQNGEDLDVEKVEGLVGQEGKNENNILVSSHNGQSVKDCLSSLTDSIHHEGNVTGELSFENVSGVCSEVQHAEDIVKDLHVLSSCNQSEDSDKEDEVFPLDDLKPVHKKLHSGHMLEWFDNQHQADTIHRLNVFRKSKQFCDLVLLVGGHELHCHRVVVGGASRAIFDELSRGEQESGPIARIPLDVARPGLGLEAVDILIEYMYTSRLLIPPDLLTGVYQASLQLGVERVTPLCRRYVMAGVHPEQAVQMRKLSQNYGDDELKQYMDNYIEENFEAISGCCEFLALPRIKVVVLILPNTSVVNLLAISLKEGIICSTTLAWIYDVIQRKGGAYLEELTEQIQRISLEDLNGAVSSFSTNHNNDYIRRISQDSEHRRSIEGSGHFKKLTRSSSMDSLKSSDSADSSSHSRCNPGGVWKVIASTQVSGTEHVVALCCLGDVLCTLSIRLPSLNSPNGEAMNGHDTYAIHNHHLSSLSSTSTSCSSSVGSTSQTQLCPLNHARCAAGVAQINNKIFVAGGFNQAECLDSVECFDTSSNRWSMVSRMSEKRARFSVAILRGKLYAVGGSTGSHDLTSVERYDPATDVWTQVQPLLFSCSESGVAVLNDLLYCVGGVQQSSSIAAKKTCQIYDPSDNQWRYTASMHTGRSSLGVATLAGCLYAVGGSDGWKCLGSAEKFDPVANHWTFTSPLNVHRRGLGLTELNDALYCIGGFDGQTFLCSVERYCPSEGDVWTLTGTSLSVPRNNVGVASLNGSVFAVGGFSGRQFLASVEIVDESSDWTSHDNSTAKGVSSDNNSHEGE